jgi:phospholipase C
VPAVVISPFIPRGTIDHTVYDHASLLATVEKMYGLKPLTRRDREANAFNHLLALETPRADTPRTLPDIADSSAARKDNSRSPSSPRELPETVSPGAGPDHIEPMLRGFLHFSFLIDYKLAPMPAKKAVMRKFLKISNRPDALRYMEEVGSRIRTRMRKKKPRSARSASQ